MRLAELRKLSHRNLWGDIAADDESFQSPSWHEEELRKTEAEFVQVELTFSIGRMRRRSCGSVLNEGSNPSPGV
jgi:hypothetical protein